MVPCLVKVQCIHILFWLANASFVLFFLSTHFSIHIRRETTTFLLLSDDYTRTIFWCYAIFQPETPKKKAMLSCWAERTICMTCRFLLLCAAKIIMVEMIQNWAASRYSIPLFSKCQPSKIKALNFIRAKENDIASKEASTPVDISFALKV